MRSQPLNLGRVDLEAFDELVHPQRVREDVALGDVEVDHGVQVVQSVHVQLSSVAGAFAERDVDLGRRVGKIVAKEQRRERLDGAPAVTLGLGGEPGDLGLGVRAHPIDRRAHDFVRGPHDRLPAGRDRRVRGARGGHGGHHGARDGVAERLDARHPDLGGSPHLVAPRRAHALSLVREQHVSREVERVTQEVDVVYLERRGGRIAVEIGHGVSAS